MRRFFSALLVLALFSVVRAQDVTPPEEPDEPSASKPILTLETGGHTGTVGLLFFTRDGKQLVSLGRDLSLRFWDVQTGALRKVLQVKCHVTAHSHGHGAALSADGKTLVLSGVSHFDKDEKCPLVFVNLEKGQVEKTLEVDGQGSIVFSIALSPDNQLVATGTLTGTFVWNAEDGKLLHEMRHAKSFTMSVAFSSDGKRLAALTNSGFQVLDLTTGKKARPVTVSSEPLTLAWGAQNRFLLVGTEEGVEMWGDPLLNKKIKSFAVGPTASLAYDPKQEYLLAAGQQPGKDAGARVGFVDTFTGQEERIYPRGGEGKQREFGVTAFSPDGKLFASAAGPSQTIFLWQKKPLKVLHHLRGQGRPSFAVGWSKDGSSIVWGGGAYRNVAEPPDLRTLNRTFDLTELKTGTLTRSALEEVGRALLTDGGAQLVLGKEPRVKRVGQNDVPLFVPANGEALSGTLLPGNRVALGPVSGIIQLDDSQTGARYGRLNLHRAAVHDMALSPDKRFLLTASSDQTLGIFDVSEKGKERLLLTLFVAGEDWVVWTPEGYYAATPGGERLMGWKIYEGRIGRFYPAERFRNKLYRPDVIQRVLQEGSVAKALEAANLAANIKEDKPIDVERLVPPTAQLKLIGPPGAKVKVRVTAKASSGQPVTGLRLLLDGRGFPDGKYAKTLAEKESPEVTWENVEIPPGIHELKVLVRGKDSADVSNSVVVPVDMPDDQKPTLFCLPVGLNYQWDPEKLKGLKLDAAENDANTILAALKAHCIGKGNRFRAVVGEPLLGQAATQTAILDRLKEITTKKGAKPGDLVVLFFAGHGVAEGKGFFLLTADVDPNKIPETALSGARLREALKEMPCQVLLILDACQSGAALPKFVPGSDNLNRALSDDEAAVTVLAAAMAHETAGEQKGNGRLTRALMETLAAGQGTFFDPEEGIMHVHHVYSKVLDLVRKDSQGKQNPMLLTPWTMPPLVIRKVAGRGTQAP